MYFICKATVQDNVRIFVLNSTALQIFFSFEIASNISRGVGKY